MRSTLPGRQYGYSHTSSPRRLRDQATHPQAWQSRIFLAMVAPQPP
jgi:hypothetical protein